MFLKIDSEYLSFGIHTKTSFLIDNIIVLTRKRIQRYISTDEGLKSNIILFF